ncbi:MAG TPA: formylglycine-generating enzyme family protein [Thermoflexia bacterium]|nr:formylglycine-generating enzyme family protein [Thermoflexia bacterium]
MGSEQITDDEKPVHKVHLERYWISRVPITNAQYRFFVEDAGHQAPKHWEDGQIPRGKESHPVVNVTWHDAMAYCRWLEEKLQVAGCKLKVWQPSGQLSTCNFQLATHQVQLPSEAEWEKAARGPALSLSRAQSRDRVEGSEVREYPWGDSWREGHCNSDELGVNDTTPVGIFPEGASPYGVLELVGNVWEWTRSHWGYAYPYVADDGREALDAGNDGLRVLRGGAFDLNQDLARCAYRFRIIPYLRNFGFRVVVSPSRP